MLVIITILQVKQLLFINVFFNFLVEHIASHGEVFSKDESILIQILQ